MEAIATSVAVDNINYTDVIRKFKEMKTMYYSDRGCMITTTIHVSIFGKVFKVYLHRPIKEIHRWEYEYFFDFGGHNAGFSYDRIIMTFSETFDKELDFEYLLMTGFLTSAGGDTNASVSVIDKKYVKDVLKLLVVGGYVKQWNAFNHFKKWFKEHGFDYDLDTSNSETMTSFIFDDYNEISS